MKTMLRDLSAQILANAIVFSGIVSVAFLLTGQWPPQIWLVAASIGGALSPFFWLVVAKFRKTDSKSPD